VASLTQLIPLTTAWTELASSAQDTTFDYQLAGSGPVAIYIGTEPPDENEQNYIVLSRKGNQFSDLIPIGFAIYAKALTSRDTSLRGYKVEKKIT